MIRLSSGARRARAILFVLNILFLMFGFTILGLGIYIKVNGNFSAIIAAYNITQALGGAAMQWIGTIMIIVGVFTPCLAAFGFLGAVRQNRVFLYLYSVIFILIILIEFAAVILILKFQNDLWKSYNSGFKEVFENAYRHNQTETINIIEKLEREFKCCGVNSYLDYTLSHYQIPKSCYRNQIPTGNPFDQGCATAVAVWIWNALPIIAGVLGSILFIEIAGVISSLVLGVAISHASTTDVYYRS